MIRTRALSLILGLALFTACDKSITEQQGVPVTISWAPCAGDPTAPTWLAVQNGTTGSWTAVTAASGAFTFDITAGRGGVAYYVAPNLNVIYGTSAELKAFAPSCSGALRSVTGTVTGYTSADGVNVDLGSGNDFVKGTTASPAPITLDGVEPFAAEVVAVRGRTNVTVTFAQTTPNSVLIRRSVSGNTLAPLDLNSTTEAIAPVSRLATIAGEASGEQIDVASEVKTANTRSTLSTYLTTLGTVSGNTSAPFYGLPATSLVTGENQQLRVKSSNQLNANTVASRYVSVAYTDVTDETLTLGPSLTAPTVTGTARPTVSYAIQPEYANVWDFTLDQPDKSVDVIMTSGYSGTATSVTVSVPDLSAAAGFSTAWLITPGVSTAWSFYASSGDPQTLNGKLGSFQAGLRTSTIVP
jgi:hypothetical protein